MSEIRKLIEALPPPAAPRTEVSPDDIAAIESEFELSLPNDYRDFLTIYGHGSIATQDFHEGYIHIYSPNNVAFPACDLHLSIVDVRSHISELHHLNPGEDDLDSFCPYDPQFVVPWGTSIDGDYFVWLVDRPSWRVAVLPRQSAFDERESSFTESVLGIVRGTFLLDGECILDSNSGSHWTSHANDG